MTLLELILALALTVVVLAAIAMAIHLQMRVVDRERTSIEEAQLARSILRLMADDLRNAVKHETVDFSAVMALASGQSLDALDDALDTGGTGGNGGTTGTGGTGGSTSAGGQTGSSGASSGTSGDTPTVGQSEDGSTENTQNIEESIAPPTKPGLFGNQYALQVDVSRLPRVDQYDVVLSGGSAQMADIPSDVKTVAYFLQPPGTNAASTAASSMTQGLGGNQNNMLMGGLVRRTLDRAVTTWAANSGNSSNVNTTGELIAAEVTYLEFRYFDGSEWWTDWDSEERGGLPVAVDIAIALQSIEEQLQLQQQPTLAAGANNELAQPRFYRLLVHLPVAEPTSEEDEAADADLDAALGEVVE